MTPIVKLAIGLGVGGLVELFTGAGINSVINNVEGGKWAKLGAKAGGYLVGAYVSDKVTGYICDTIDDSTESFRRMLETGEGSNIENEF